MPQKVIANLCWVLLHIYVGNQKNIRGSLSNIIMNVTVPVKLIEHVNIR